MHDPDPVPDAPARPKPRVLDWRSHRSGSLRGFCNVVFPSGLIVHGVSVHRMGGRCWAAPPTKPRVEHDVLLRGGDGRVSYCPVLGFVTHGSRRRWSDAILAALHEAEPGALDPGPGEGTP